MSELVVIESLNAHEIFEEEGAQNIIAIVAQKARDFEPDMTTVSGRKEIASMAHKVAKSKTLIDGMGKDLVAGWKASSKLVDAQRKIIREKLDALRDDIRQPLNDFEDAEKERIQIHKDLIQEFANAGNGAGDAIRLHPLEAVEERLAEIRKDRSRSWQEFESIAYEAADKAIEQFEAAISAKKEADKQAKELEALRAEKAEREKLDREKRIAEDAKLAAENSAKIEAEKQAKINGENLARIEREKDQEIQRAKDDQEAVRKNAEKIAADLEKKKADDLAKEKAEIKAREDDLKHRGEINNNILAALVECGITEKQGKIIIGKIFKGDVPNVRINY